MGCRLSLDDFGTGYSSLLHLQSMPFDKLKVDRSFVSSMTEFRQSRKIVAAVVGLGQSLDLINVAEGIETQEQAEMLLWLGCEMGQGYLYGRPAPGDQLAAMLAAPPQCFVSSDSSPWHTVTAGCLDVQPAQRLAHLQAVYDGAPVGLGFIDRNLRYVNLNKKLADMNGATVEQHLGSPVAEMIPELFPAVKPFLERALRGEAITDVEATSPAADGVSEETRLLSYQPAVDEAGEVVGVSVAVVDITERKRALEALRESEEHYRHMVQLNPQILWIMDAQGKNLDVSPRWEPETGMMREHSSDRGWLNSLHPDDLEPTATRMAELMQRGAPIYLEYRTQDHAGGWRWKRSRGSPRSDAKGNIVCWYGSVEDIEAPNVVEELPAKAALRMQPAVFPGSVARNDQGMRTGSEN
jgi:PAS domain S-box-containing protein